MKSEIIEADSAELIFRQYSFESNLSEFSTENPTFRYCVFQLPRPDASNPNMDLTVWKATIVRKRDIATAKNYLTETEVDELNRIVVMWLDFAKDQARRRKQVFLKDWTQRLDDFLAFNDRDVLPNAVLICKMQADTKARNKYEKFSEQRRKSVVSEGAEAMIKVLAQLAKKKLD